MSRASSDPAVASRIVVRTQWARPDAPTIVSLELNGQGLSNPRPRSASNSDGSKQIEAVRSAIIPALPDIVAADVNWTEYEVKPGSLKKGPNFLDVTVRPPEGKAAAEVLELLQVHIAIEKG